MSTFMVQLGVMSQQASAAVLAVFLLRKIFGWCGVTKKYAVLLWLIPFFLLICPWKISSPVGIFLLAPSDYNTDYAQDALERGESFFIRTEKAALSEVIQEDFAGTEKESGQGEQNRSQNIKLSESQTPKIPIYSWQKVWTVITVGWFWGFLLLERKTMHQWTGIMQAVSAECRMR